MAKLHRCEDGTLVTDKVLLFQETRKSDDYKPILFYYDNYKDKWFSDLKDYLDKPTFDSEFDFKLFRAVDTFDGEQAFKLCKKYNWKRDGAFNRWFFAVLRNWKSNVKTSAFRQKKRPSVQCPVCGRYVPRIDELHLAHYKTKSDLPSVVRWKGQIYSVYASPVGLAVCWGDHSDTKMSNLLTGKNSEHTSEKTRVRWPWYTPDGRRGVLCPFTEKVISEINVAYLATLSNEYSRYARPMKWYDFIEEYPSPTLIQAEVYSLDYHLADEDPSFQESISITPKRETAHDIDRKEVSMEYEHVFHLIETHVKDELDQKVLKLASVGYSDDDIASALEMPRKEVRQRKGSVRAGSLDLRDKLLDSV